jgi:hypothetical protein
MKIDRLPVAVGHIDEIESDQDQDYDPIYPIRIEIEFGFVFGILVFFHSLLSDHVMLCHKNIKSLKGF